MKNKKPIFILLFLLSFVLEASADIIHLKNGRTMEGLIKKETVDDVWLDLGFGSVKFRREEIERIDRSDSEEIIDIRREWQQQRALQQERWKEEAAGPKEVEFFKSGSHIYVNALLNNKVKAYLILDTGAPGILLSKRISKELGIKTQGLEITKAKLLGISDLRQVRVVLDSVSVEGAEVTNVEAWVSLDEMPEVVKDGLLGLSFVRRFDFQIDSVNKKLILEKRNPQNILEKTKYFTVIIPSDWETWKDGEALRIAGPNLAVKKGSIKPYITIQKLTNKTQVDYLKSIKAYCDSWKGSSNLKDRMLEGLKMSFEQNDLQGRYLFISSDFEETKGFIILHTVFIKKEDNTKNYVVELITKTEPLKSYYLSFLCAEKYFDKYLPVFEKCMESFSVIE